MIRHGDVCLAKVTGKVNLSQAKVIPMKGNMIVLAEGEVTGHSHTIDMSVADGIMAQLLELENGDRYLEVKGGSVTLTHQEHAPIILSPGLYKNNIQREYTPEEVRNVRD